MPASYTHFCFYKQFPDSSRIEKLGNQGGDIFFYYGYSIWWWFRTRKKKTRRFGELLHNQAPYLYLKHMYEYALDQNDKTKDVLLNYLQGYLGHYYLDSTTHPYVHAKAITKKKKANTIRHAKLETDIDVEIPNHLEIKTKKVSSKIIRTKNKEVKAVSKMYEDLARNYFKIKYIKAKTFYKSYKDMKLVLNVLNGRTNFKKDIINLAFKRSIINAMAHPSFKQTDPNPELVTSHEQWIHPFTIEPVKDSFMDLFNSAITLYQTGGPLIKNLILDKKDYLSVLEKETSILNFDGKAKE
jgi:hypothetical protein